MYKPFDLIHYLRFPFFCSSFSILLFSGEETDTEHTTISTPATKIHGRDGPSGSCFTFIQFICGVDCSILSACGDHIQKNRLIIFYVALKNDLACASWHSEMTVYSQGYDHFEMLGIL